MSKYTVAEHGAMSKYTVAEHGAPPKYSVAENGAPPKYNIAENGAPPKYTIAENGAPPKYTVAENGAPPKYTVAENGAPLTHRLDIASLESMVASVKNTQEKVKQEYEDKIRAERCERRVTIYIASGSRRNIFLALIRILPN